MNGNQVGGAILMLVGLLFTLTFFGAIIGIPMIIVGAVLAGSSNSARPAVTQQVNIYTDRAPHAYELGDVVNGHILDRVAGELTWRPLTADDRRALHISQMERDLGIAEYRS